MNDRTVRYHVHRALDTRLSGLTGDPWLTQRVLANGKGVPKGKKKLSVGFVLLIVLLLAAVTALAAALLWEQQVVPMKELEQAQGDYMDWPIAQKQTLIRTLIDTGSIAESDETARLFDSATDEAQQHAIADQLLLTLTGQTDVREISVDIITYAIMGFMDTWTPAQRVWWRQVTEQVNGDMGAPDTPIVPTEDVLPEADAVAIAKAAILEAYALPSNALDSALPVSTLYVTDARPDYRRWDVQFKLFREGSDSYVERIYVAVVDEYGQVIDDPDVGVSTPKASAERQRALQEQSVSPLWETIRALYSKEGDMPIWAWSLETKAEYTQVVAPQVRAIVESGDLSPLIHPPADEPDPHVMASSTYTYGLPGEQDMPQETALSLAKQAIMDACGFGTERMALYSNISIFFDVTDPACPLWRFVFSPEASA